MIALEMSTEVELPTKVVQEVGLAETPTITVEFSGACSMCGLRAFELLPGLSNEQMIVCLGCPPPAPFRLLNRNAVMSDANRYRCCRCGSRPLVTMTLSDVNLHCRRCGQLTLHERQDDPPKTAGKRVEPTDAGRRQLIRTIDRVAASLLENEAGPARASGCTVKFAGVLRFDNDPAFVQLTRSMMSILGLEDFDAYAARKRGENLASGTDIERDRRIGLSCDRRTGRTMRGIVALLAHYYFAAESWSSRSFPLKVWVLGGSESCDKWLLRKVILARNRLGNVRPTTVETTPDASTIRRNSRDWAPPSGVVLLVDHTFYERDRDRAGVSYLPNF